MITGSAPIKGDVFEFMKVIMGCAFYEGYGQTENTAAAFITNSIDPISGHVGGIVVTLSIILLSHPYNSNLWISQKCTTPAKIKMNKEDPLLEEKYG